MIKPKFLIYAVLLLQIFVWMLSCSGEEVNEKPEEWFCQCEAAIPFTVVGSEECYATRTDCRDTESVDECINCFECAGCPKNAPWSVGESVSCYDTYEDCENEEGMPCVICD